MHFGLIANTPPDDESAATVPDRPLRNFDMRTKSPRRFLATKCESRPRAAMHRRRFTLAWRAILTRAYHDAMRCRRAGQVMAAHT